MRQLFGVDPVWHDVGVVIADNLAQAAAAGAAGGGTLVALIALGIEWRRRNKSRKRPPEDLIALLQWLYTSFGEILYHNGKELHWFWGEERLKKADQLEAISGQIVDEVLRERVENALELYSNAFLGAPTDWTLGVEMWRDPLDFQISTAEDGRAASMAAINRVNELLRRYPQYQPK